MTNPHATTPKPSNNALNGNGKLHDGADSVFSIANGTTHDFTENLVEKCTENPLHAFTPEVIEQLASLKFLL